MFNKYSVCVLFGFLQLSTAANYGTCITPKNEIASCIEITECKSLFQLTQKPSLTPEEIEFLKKSQCGYMAKKVLVCCPPESYLPRPPKCGQVLTNRIKGGNVTAIDEYPWTALLEYTNDLRNQQLACGGSLISDRYVITAAHCLLGLNDGYRVSGVRLGEWNLEMDPDYELDAREIKYWAPTYTRAHIEQQIIHPQYTVGSKNFDIALLRLTKSITINDFIRPICLPFESSLRNATFADREADVVGWGYTESGILSNIKLKATITVWDFKRCQAKYQSQYVLLQSNQMCAGGVKGIDACRGDSGGPLVREETIRNMSTAYYLIGVVSFGPNPCALSNWPGVYTRVSDYLGWIDKNVKP